MGHLAKPVLPPTCKVPDETLGGGGRGGGGHKG